jgi:Ran GTPase-activating protein 1
METNKSILTVEKQKKYNTFEDCAELVKELKSDQKYEVLEFSGATFSLEACKLIAENLQSHPIKIANFNDMFTGKKSDEIPHAVKHLMDALRNKEVSSLDWSDNAFGPNGVRGFIDYMAGNTICVSLNINNTGLGPEGGRLVANGLKGYTLAQYDSNDLSKYTPAQYCKLEKFIAGRGRLEDVGIIALSQAFEAMKSLKILYLPQSGITPKGMISLAKALKDNNNLEELNLYDNNIGKKSGATEMITAISGMKRLKLLNLGDCMLGIKAVTALAKVLKTMNTLEELDLSYDGVNDDTVKVLQEVIENNPNLRVLNLNGNHMTSNGIKEIKKSLEKVDKSNALMTLSDNDSEASEDESSDDSVDELAEALSHVKISNKQPANK